MPEMEVEGTGVVPESKAVNSQITKPQEPSVAKSEEPQKNPAPGGSRHVLHVTDRSEDQTHKPMQR